MAQSWGRARGWMVGVKKTTGKRKKKNTTLIIYTNNKAI
jgi:hypothetical protein